MMLADISGLIGLIVFVVIAIISAVLKRKEEPFEIPPELKPGRDIPPQQRPPAPRTWEQELRDLLEQRPAPPPVVWQAPAPVPPPIPSVPRASAMEESESHESHDAGYHGMASFKESESRYADASSLQERVAHHLAEVTRHRVGTTTVTRHESSPAARELMNLLRDPQTVRRAMLASIVLGPPRALES